MNNKKIEKYKDIAKKYGLNLTDADIVCIKSFCKVIIREEIKKIRKNAKQKRK